MSYCGSPPVPGEILLRWNFDPWLLAALLATLGLVRFSARPTAFLLGWAVLALAFVSPLCAMSVSLFSARAAHHLLLVSVAAPLLALGFPPRRDGFLAPAFILSTLVFWAWHLPALYDPALARTDLYWAMQLSLLGSATLFWRALFLAQAVPAMLTLVGAMAQMGLLAAILTFAPEPFYASHLFTTLPWNLTALGDQQLAGLVMWVPGMIPYAAALALLARRVWNRGEAVA
ncbi:MAG: cytochrome c oxidase assembly protein [Methylobacterium mesophilicum]|nr:cytochrome c oxidase assembly protein [Methylobacterium mesophilicum]